MAGCNHYGANEMEERTCAKCGKVFLPAPYHRFREKSKGLWYCCWTCYNHKDDAKEEEEQHPKESIEFRECTDCKHFVYCDWYKILFHKSTGTPCDEFKEQK